MRGDQRHTATLDRYLEVTLSHASSSLPFGLGLPPCSLPAEGREARGSETSPSTPRGAGRPIVDQRRRQVIAPLQIRVAVQRTVRYRDRGRGRGVNRPDRTGLAAFIGVVSISRFGDGGRRGAVHRPYHVPFADRACPAARCEPRGSGRRGQL